MIVSLSIVMGLAWIGQTIYVIFTDNRVIENIIDCFIACQGIIIFILLVPLSKQVCASTHASLKLFYLILLNFVQVRDAYQVMEKGFKLVEITHFYHQDYCS